VKIERAVLREIPLQLVQPFQSSAGVIGQRRVVLLTLEADGLEGWSECVALAQPTYTYETTDTAWQILTEILLPVVVGTDCSDPAEVLRRAEDGGSSDSGSKDAGSKDSGSKDSGSKSSDAKGGSSDSKSSDSKSGSSGSGSSGSGSSSKPSKSGSAA
jgi:hypothetical protein